MTIELPATIKRLRPQIVTLNEDCNIHFEETILISKFALLKNAVNHKIGNRYGKKE